MLNYLENYGPFKELVKSNQQTIYTKDINHDTIDIYFRSLINILKDGIETEEVQSMMITIIFEDNVDIRLSIFDLVINLMMWQLNAKVGVPIYSYHLFFPDNISAKEIKLYIDNIFIDKYRKKMPFINLNQTIDAAIGKFSELVPFQMYLANTLNLEDFVDLMNQYQDFYDAMHFCIDGIPLSDIKDEGMKATNTLIKRIIESDHCLRNSFRTNEGVSAKQFKEVAVNVGTKPNGQGSIYPTPISHSYMNGGLQSPTDLFIDSSVGRFAQILQKNNVGDSGAFARNLELNNQETILHPDPNYTCDTQHFQEVFIDNETKLRMFDLRYYRENPNGVDKLLEFKHSKHLVGRKLYFRSPMTCASATRGHGICYKCYGDLAYTNQEINIGQIAAENLSAIYTQILLSAKHLLESLVIKMNWSKEFYDLFQVEYNIIRLKDDMKYKGYKLIIDSEIMMEDDFDEVAYNNYIYSFTVRYPNGQEVSIHTEDDDNIYFTVELLEFLNKKKNKYITVLQDDIIEIDMQALEELSSLFVVEIKNNELSRTMDAIKKLIDSSAEIKKHDRHSLLEKFINTNIQGGITLNSVHFEVILMNQIRSLDDEIELPDWSLRDARYQILTLDASLKNSRSITTRLQNNNTPTILLNPKNDFLEKPAQIDLFYMEKPQEYLNPEYISDEYQPRSDKEESAEEPVTFDNPKLVVGRKAIGRKVSKREAMENN